MGCDGEVKGRGSHIWLDAAGSNEGESEGVAVGRAGLSLVSKEGSGVCSAYRGDEVASSVLVAVEGAHSTAISCRGDDKDAIVCDFVNDCSDGVILVAAAVGAERDVDDVTAVSVGLLDSCNDYIFAGGLCTAKCFIGHDASVWSDADEAGRVESCGDACDVGAVAETVEGVVIWDGEALDGGS